MPSKKTPKNQMPRTKDGGAVQSNVKTLLSPTVPSTSIPVSVAPTAPDSINAVSPLSTETLAAARVPELTMPQKLWNAIKDRPIEMFGLPNQTPSKYCQPVFIEPTKLYLTFTIGSVLPALEEMLKIGYNVSLLHQYIVIEPKSALSK